MGNTYESGKPPELAKGWLPVERHSGNSDVPRGRPGSLAELCAFLNEFDSKPGSGLAPCVKR